MLPGAASHRFTRRTMLGAAAAMASMPALAQECQIGPPDHHKGPKVFRDYDQFELDAAYDQDYYEPLQSQVHARLKSSSNAVRERLGDPQRVSYGPTNVEMLDIYRTTQRKAAIFVFMHGGIWLQGSARDCGYAAEMFMNAGAHFIALDFVSVDKADGDLGVMVAQVRRAIAWVHKNTASFDGDPERLYIGGHSSGGHLCGVALLTDWQGEFGLPADTVKGGLCMSGLFDMEPVRLSWRRSYIKFTDAMEDAMSTQRHLDKLNAPVVVPTARSKRPNSSGRVRNLPQR
jgi:arylformamidase